MIHLRREPTTSPARCSRTWSVVCCTVLSLLAGPGAELQAQRNSGPPNIVVVLVDDLGYGDLTGYGGQDLRTPHLDGLAAAGMRFDHFYANSSVCSPTRAALLTGRYPDLVGVPGVVRTHAVNSWGYLSPQAVLLPQVLKRSGYHTAIVGKWHLGLESPNIPAERGFDHAYTFLGDMMDDFVHHRRHGINYMREGRVEIDPPGHATDLFTREAVEYIRARGEEASPFFLYLAYNAPHTPVQPPQEWLDRVRAREPDLPVKRARLVAFIEHMDAGVGEVLAALRETGQHENTLVLFVSDNGGQLEAGASNGALRGSKTEMYEGGIRVPAFAAWPGRIAPGSRSDAVLMTMDIFPTVAAAAGASFDHRIDGESFLPILTGRNAEEDPRTLFWVRREGGREAGLPTYAIREGDWKLLQNRPGTPFELYNLRSDPAEQNDRAGAEPQVMDRLLAQLRMHIQRSGRLPWQPPQ